MKASLLLLTFYCLTLTTAAQVVDPGFSPPASYYTTGEVYTVGPAQADGKRLIAGDFSSISGTATGPVARLDAAGNLDQAFARNLGAASNVYRIKLLPTGQYLLGAQGGFIGAGGLVRTEVMRLNANGTGDASFDAGTGPTWGTAAAYGIDYAVQPDGKVLVGGNFTEYNGVPAGSLVRLTTTGSVDPSFSVGTGATATVNGSYVSAILVQSDGKLLVGGQFTHFNGHAANDLVRLNADGSVDTSFAVSLAAYSYVTGLVAQPDGKVLVSGSFGTSSSGARMFRLLPSGSIDPTFTLASVLNGLSISAYGDPPMAVQPDGKIVLFGDFYAGSSVTHLARANADGSQDLTFQPAVQPTKSPKTVGVQPDGSILVGVYNTATYVPRNAFGTTEATLAQYTSAGVYNGSYPARVQAAGTVYAVARQADGSLLVGGSFAEWNGQAVHHLVHLSSSGVLDTGFSSQLGLFPGPVKSLLVQPDGKILANAAVGPLRVAASGSPDASFSAQPNVTYFPAMALQPDGKLLVGGFASTPINGVVHNGMLRLTSTGALDPTFVRATSSLGVGREADAIVVQPDGRIVVASAAYPTGGGVVQGVVRYESTGAVDATFTPQQFTGQGNATHLYALALQADGKLLVGGYFAQAGSLSQAGVARLTATGLPDNTFGSSNTLISGPVYSLAIQPNRRILLGGTFAAISGTTALTSLARLLDNGQLDKTFMNTGTPDGSVASLLVQPDGAIVLGGSFAAIYGQPNLGVARLLAANVLAVAAPAAIATPTAAWPVPAHSQLHVAPDLGAQPQTLELLDALGRQLRRQSWVGTAPEATLDTNGLPAGQYLLRVTYAAGPVTRRITIE